MEMNGQPCSTATLLSRQEAHVSSGLKLGEPQRQGVGSSEHVFLCPYNMQPSTFTKFHEL